MRFASTFASDGKTQLINQPQVPVLAQQQPNVLQQMRNKTQDDGIVLFVINICQKGQK